MKNVSSLAEISIEYSTSDAHRPFPRSELQLAVISPPPGKSLQIKTLWLLILIEKPFAVTKRAACLDRQGVQLIRSHSLGPMAALKVPQLDALMPGQALSAKHNSHLTQLFLLLQMGP